MALPVDLGDVPTWLTAATPFAVLHIEGRRRERVADLGRKVEALVESVDDLQAKVVGSEELEELVNRAVEDAARTTWTAKLDALAAVVAVAIDGDDEAVSTSLLVEAVLSRLERHHVTALRRLQQGGVQTRFELVDGWPSAGRTVEALLAVLASEGLIRDVSGGTWDGVEGQERWVLTEFGEELLVLLSPDAVNMGRGAIAVESTERTLVVRNSGTAVLRLVEVKVRGGAVTVTAVPSDRTPNDYPLAPGERIQSTVTMIASGPAEVVVIWEDGNGQTTESFMISLA